MNRVKLSEVADHSGVSLTTASLVLNGKGNISDEVREKVMASAEKLGYIRNTHAASIASQKVVNLAILVNEDYERAFEWHLIRSIFISIETVLYDNKCFPILIPVSDKQSNAEILEKVILSGAGGVFTIHFGNRELYRQLEDRKIPVVILNNHAYENEFYTVCSEIFSGMYEATKRLIQLGHSQFAFIDYPRPDFPAVVIDRFMGFQKAIMEFGLDFPENRRFQVRLKDMDGIGETIDLLLNQNPRPTALVIHDDYLAAMVYVVLQKKGIDIPGDISMIAPGDSLDYNQPFIPQISTSRINSELMGKLGAEMMLRRLEGSSDSIELLKVQPSLVRRGTCREIVKGGNSE